MQQRGLVDQRRVGVHAMHREGEREGRAAVRQDHVVQALQRLGMLRQALFDGRLRAEGAEERREIPIITSVAVTVSVSVIMRALRCVAA